MQGVADALEKTKKSRATNVPGKFIREASRLGDVGPFSGPWVCRAGRPTKTENSVREKTLYRDAVIHCCGSKRKIAFLAGNTTVKLLIQPCVNCINLGLRKLRR